MKNWLRNLMIIIGIIGGICLCCFVGTIIPEIASYFWVGAVIAAGAVGLLFLGCAGSKNN